jgi:cyclase
MDALHWALRAAELGAGELLVTSIDREGTGKGFDLELTRRIAQSVPIPVIASGGAGNIEHIRDVITHGSADAVSVASILHYNYTKNEKYSDADFSEEGNIEFLRQKRTIPSGIQGASVSEIKEYLVKHGISCRT